MWCGTSIKQLSSAPNTHCRYPTPLLFPPQGSLHPRALTVAIRHRPWLAFSATSLAELGTELGLKRGAVEAFPHTARCEQLLCCVRMPEDGMCLRFIFPCPCCVGYEISYSLTEGEVCFLAELTSQIRRINNQTPNLYVQMNVGVCLNNKSIFFSPRR